MAKIKITQKQALMLENLNKPKVLRITEAQYNAILKHEGLGEGAVITQIANSLPSKDKSEYIKNVGSETRIKGVFKESEGLWKEFVNELYGLNESGNQLYEKLIKLMEACGYVENRKLSKTKFEGDKNTAKDVITSGLNKLQECGSPYMAMEHMENEYDRITQSLKQQLTQEPTSQFSDEEKDKEIQRRRALELQRRRETGEIPIKEEGDEDVNNQNGIVGLDILNYEPFRSLPDTRDEVGDYTVRMEPKLPSLDTADGSDTIFSKEDFTDRQLRGSEMSHTIPGYISKFRKLYNEDPIFINLTPGRFGKADIANEKFLNWREGGKAAKKSYMDSQRGQGMSSGLDEEEVDEMTSMGGSGAVFGNQGGDFPVGKLRESGDDIYDEIANELGISSDEFNYALDNSMAELNSIERIYFSDIYTQDEKLSMIADMLNINYNPIQNKIYEALDTLKKSVEGETEEHLEEESEDTLEEVTTTDSSGQYATTGFAPSEFMGTAGKKGKAPVSMKKKTPIWPGGTIVGESATDKTQGGSFVEFDDCVKLNNNKEAQNGGCSTGAVDNVVKLRKTASNVNTISLGKKQGE
jgi:hypothetical protein